MQAVLLTLLAVAIVSLVSLIGAALLTMPWLRRHSALLALVAIAAGALVGDAFLHIVPEAFEAWEGYDLVGLGLTMAAGFLAFFILEVGLRVHHAHAEVLEFAHAPSKPAVAPTAMGQAMAKSTIGHAHSGHQGHHGPPSHDAHAHHAHGHHDHGDKPIAAFAWTNLIGDGLHNLLDGAVIATAFLADAALGWATTIAVIAHEVPQELGDFAVLLQAGLSRGKALMLNLASACTAFVGAAAVLLLPIAPETIERFGLPFTGGAFLYIAAADLIPELHHHSRGRAAYGLLAWFAVGLGLMAGLLLLE